MDIRTKKCVLCVFLQPRWWGETFCPLGILAQGSELSGHHSLFSVHALFLQVFCTSFFGNKNATFLCSLFTEFTGECNHSHVQSLFTVNGSSECSSIHMSVGDYQHRRKSLKTNRHTDLRKRANDDAMQGVHSNHKSRERSLFTFFPFTAAGSLITQITFTHSLRSRELWPLRSGMSAGKSENTVVSKMITESICVEPQNLYL